VTAFLFSSNVGRPFWNTAIMGPRFVASAFTGGTALLVLAFEALRRVSRVAIEQRVFDLLALVLAVSVQVNLFLIGVELFTDFYNQAEHSISARYLYFGLGGYRALVPWIWSAIALLIVAGVILTLHPIRRRPELLALACIAAVVGVWIDKAMGLVVPGFVPTPIGEVFDYSPTRVETMVSAGIWAVGSLSSPVS
jgi:Ni/Fe-hydrogenase subunit HybB-like protein